MRLRRTNQPLPSAVHAPMAMYANAFLAGLIVWPPICTLHPSPIFMSSSPLMLAGLTQDVSHHTSRPCIESPITISFFYTTIYPFIWVYLSPRLSPGGPYIHTGEVHIALDRYHAIVQFQTLNVHYFYDKRYQMNNRFFIINNHYSAVGVVKSFLALQLAYCKGNRKAQLILYVPRL